MKGPRHVEILSYDEKDGKDEMVDDHSYELIPCESLHRTTEKIK